MYNNSICITFISIYEIHIDERKIIDIMYIGYKDSVLLDIYICIAALLKETVPDKRNTERFCIPKRRKVNLRFSKKFHAR